MGIQEQQAPMLKSPLGKPAINTRDSVKPMGAMWASQNQNTEYKQVSFAMKSSGGAKAASKGAAWSNANQGCEYKQASSTK